MNDQSNRTAATALVLGAGGFIGRHVCRTLSERGFVVLGIGHGQWSEQEQRDHGISRWLDADIDAGTLKRVTEGTTPAVVLHCAGSGAVSHSFSAPAADHQRSVGTTLAMLEYARTLSIAPRVVLTSSAAVYGDQGNVDIAEDAPLRPMSPYGYHKVMAEMLCESYSRFFSIETRVVRLFSVFGQGLRKQLLWDALNKFKRGETSFFGTGEELRDWIHVEDAARLLATAATSPAGRHHAYNGGGFRATTCDVLCRLAAAAGTAFVPEFSGEVHTGNPRRLTANHHRATSELGFTAEIALDEGLQRYADWFMRDAGK
jgi:UDP-glucose 4-epimerase